ncbi:MAG TPA: translation factor GTPase family protein [Jatrophihabitans sp.]|nr:translation factor GTPase family protein [Jatrophihabitans sp.]
MRMLNLGILAHVDAGKTSLTERLLYAAGVIDEVGSVDRGSTQTDFLDLERQRGITIRSAVASFVVDDVAINLIDTPGHPDFIAEVERVLNVLDGAVLVVSAVEGVQAQTRVLMRVLQRLGIPTLIFINKVDRAGAAESDTLRDVAKKLTPSVVAMGRVDDLGTRAARVTPFGAADGAFAARLRDTLADHDDELLDLFVTDEAALSFGQLLRQLRAQTARTLVHPVFFGSAMTGAGVDQLTRGLIELLPVAQGDPDDELSATTFKVERGPADEKIAYVRMFSGALQVRDRVEYGERGRAKVTAISVFDGGRTVREKGVGAGQIAKVWGLADVRVGDAIGRRPSAATRHFAPPTLETVVVPRPGDQGVLRAALRRLAEQDPLINVRQDDIRDEISVSLYGEVQKEVVQATLADEFGVDVTFRETTTICIERPVGAGCAAEIIGTDRNPFLATVGLRIDPAPGGAGVRFRLGVEPGSMPPAFFRAVEETVHSALGQGLCGWRVTDCTVTMTHAGYWARQSHAHATFDKTMSSTAGDFRNLTPLVLMAALRKAGTRVFEPIHRFRAEVPMDTLAAVLHGAAELGAVPEPPALHDASAAVDGVVPAARVHALQQQLPTLTRGEGLVETEFDHYQVVRGAPPSRPRTDHNPLDRKEYLLRVQRRRGLAP